MPATHSLRCLDTLRHVWYAIDDQDTMGATVADLQKDDPNPEREAISLCGFNCGICPAYKANLRTDGDRAEVDRGWRRFHRTRGWVYEKPHCEGCFNTPGSSPLWSSCPTRKCVLTNKVENCGYCLHYSCSRINWLAHAIDLIAARTKREGTKDDFKKFVMPYLSRTRLDRIHEKVIADYPDLPPETTDDLTADFPSALKLKGLKPASLSPAEFARALQNLRSVLARTVALRCRTVGGRQQELKKRKEQAKLLWVIGKDGRLDSDQGVPLIIITLEHLREHVRYGTSRLSRNLQELSRHGVEGGLTDDRLKVTFPEEPKTAIALKHYTTVLLRNDSERTAYSKFWKADMDVFGRE